MGDRAFIHGAAGLSTEDVYFSTDEGLLKPRRGVWLIMTVVEDVANIS